MGRAVANLKEIRIAKERAVAIIKNLKLGKVEWKHFRIVSRQVGLSTRQVKLAWNNYMKYGYVDGHAKDGHTDRLSSISVSKRAYEVQKRNGYKNIALNTVVVTPAIALRAFSLWMSGEKVWNIHKNTGVGTNTLYSVVKEFEKSGKILGKTYYEPIDQNIFNTRNQALEKKMVKKPNSKVNKKRMQQIYIEIADVTLDAKQNKKVYKSLVKNFNNVKTLRKSPILQNR